MEQSNQELKREIGVWGLSANIINIIVGAGIFVLPAIVSEGLGAASILAYLFCGVLIAFIMLCFAEVGGKVTKTRGAYAYIEVAFGKYAGFLTSILFVACCVTADAAVANALANVLGSIFSIFKNSQIRILLFFLLFAGFAFINILGVKDGIRFVKINTAIKLIPLFFLAIFGWFSVSFSNLEWQSVPSFTDIGQMSLILFFAFQGGEAGLTVSGEVKNPQTTIPKAIFISIFIVLLLYGLIQLVSQGVLGESLSNYKEAPLAELAKIIIGPIGFTLIIISAAISMFGSLSGEILSMPRVLYGAARDKVIPINILAKVHKKYATPYVSIIVYAGFGFLLASFGGFKQLAILAGAAALLIYFGVAASTIKLRKIKIENKNQFKLPFGIFFPVVSMLICVWFLSNLSYDEKIGIIIFLSAISILYFVIKIFKINRVKIPKSNMK